MDLNHLILVLMNIICKKQIFFILNQFLIYGAKQLKDGYRYFTVCVDATLQFEMDKDFCRLLIYHIPMMQIAIAISTSLLKKVELLFLALGNIYYSLALGNINKEYIYIYIKTVDIHVSFLVIKVGTKMARPLVHLI